MIEDKTIKCHRFEMSTVGTTSSTYIKIDGKTIGLIDKICIFADSSLNTIHISGIRNVLGSNDQERFELDFK